MEMLSSTPGCKCLEFYNEHLYHVTHRGLQSSSSISSSSSSGSSGSSSRSIVEEVVVVLGDWWLSLI